MDGERTDGAMAAAEQLTCPRDGVESKLTCVHCRTPICPSCFVRTPVGLQCPTCAPVGKQRRRAAGGRAWRIVAGVAAVAAIGAVALVPRLVGGDDTAAGPVSDEEAGVDASKPDAVLNQEVNIGPVVLTVTRVSCIGNQIGTPPVTRLSSAGKYCAVYFTARSTSAQPEIFSSSIQLLTDGGRRYGPELPPPGTTTPTFVTVEGGVREVLGARLNPQQAVTGAMVFDVAADFEPRQLLLRFTPRSPLVRVSLAA